MRALTTRPRARRRPARPQVEQLSDEAFFIELSAAAPGEGEGVFDALLAAVDERIGDWLHLVESGVAQGYREAVGHSNPDFYRRTAQRVALNVFHKINEIKNDIDIDGSRAAAGAAAGARADAEPPAHADSEWAERDESRARSVLRGALEQLGEHLHPTLFTNLVRRVRERLKLGPGDL